MGYATSCPSRGWTQIDREEAVDLFGCHGVGLTNVVFRSAKSLFLSRQRTLFRGATYDLDKLTASKRSQMVAARGGRATKLTLLRDWFSLFVLPRGPGARRGRGGSVFFSVLNCFSLWEFGLCNQFVGTHPVLPW